MAEPIYEIVRSFSKTVQVKQFEPESNFCSVKESFYEMPTEEEKKKKSAELYEFARQEVLKAFNQKNPVYKKFENLTPDEYEALPEAKKAELQEQKKENNRVKYQVNKNIGFIKRFPCNICNEDHPINQKKCVQEEQFTPDRYNMKEQQ